MLALVMLRSWLSVPVPASDPPVTLNSPLPPTVPLTVSVPLDWPSAPLMVALPSVPPDEVILPLTTSPPLIVPPESATGATSVPLPWRIWPAPTATALVTVSAPRH